MYGFILANKMPVNDMKARKSATDVNEIFEKSRNGSRIRRVKGDKRRTAYNVKALRRARSTRRNFLER